MAAKSWDKLQIPMSLTYSFGYWFWEKKRGLQGGETCVSWAYRKTKVSEFRESAWNLKRGQAGDDISCECKRSCTLQRGRRTIVDDQLVAQTPMTKGLNLPDNETKLSSRGYKIFLKKWNEKEEEEKCTKKRSISEFGCLRWIARVVAGTVLESNWHLFHFGKLRKFLLLPFFSTIFNQ